MFLLNLQVHSLLTSPSENELAIKGGQQIVDYTFPGWPHYEQDEIDKVRDVLYSGKVNYWTGDIGREFENQFANYFGVKHAVALSNGSVALELALSALNIGEGDEVIVTSRTFIASVSSICLIGATPVFADVDRNSQNITAESIQSCISSKSRAIILVHLAGWPCEMEGILDLANKHNLKIIEDCAQSHGALYKNKLVGSFGDVGTFSFCQDKIMSTGGEGGMLVTNDEDLWKKAWAYKDHGKDLDTISSLDHSDSGQFKWVHNSLGTNLRMTEMQAAIGIIQLTKLNSWLKIRRNYANILNKSFSEIDALRVTIPDNNIKHAYYKYYVFLRPDRINSEWSRDKIVQAINAEGVPCFMGSCSEVYKEKAFLDSGLYPKKNLVKAKELGETSLMFNIHPSLSINDVEKMCCAVRKVLKHAAL